MSRIKVFGGLVHMGARGQLRTIVAASSQVKAAEAVGCPLSDIRGWWSVTGNETEWRQLCFAATVVYAQELSRRGLRPKEAH